jgi:single-strand DNA-binding protein
MINKVILMGRITHDLELKQTQSGTPVLSFNLAVERKFQKQGEPKQTDFINCVAWRQLAEFISKYFGKGSLIAIEGNLRTRSYDDKNGTKHYITEVYVDSASFTGEKPKTNTNAANGYTPQPQQQQEQQANNQAANIGDISDFEEILSDDGMPF